MPKTNAMRMLEDAKIPYKMFEYAVVKNGQYGQQAAAQLAMPADGIFKTLVTRGDNGRIHVFCIPVNHQLHLKKAAVVSRNKKIEMLPEKEVWPITGYKVGACSPVGMKKAFPTYIDETAVLFDEIGVSAGIKGGEIVLNPTLLCNFVKGQFADLTTE